MPNTNAQNLKRSPWGVHYNGRWQYAGPPHSGTFFRSHWEPCPCEDCDLYYRWEAVADALTADVGC